MVQQALREREREVVSLCKPLVYIYIYIHGHLDLQCRGGDLAGLGSSWFGMGWAGLLA